MHHGSVFIPTLLLLLIVHSLPAYSLSSDKISDDEVDSTGIELYNEAAYLINQAAEFAQGDSLMLEAREELRDTPFWDVYGATYLTLGFSWQLQQRELWEIIDQFRKGLQVVEENTDHPHRLRSLLYDNMQSTFRHHGVLDSARVYVDKAIEEGLQSLDGEHMGQLGQYYGNAANIYGELGLTEIALNYYNRAEEIFSRILPDYHEHWAVHFANLSMVYKRLGDMVKSRQYQERSYEILQEVYGYEDPRYYRNQTNYTRMLSESESPEVALEHITGLLENMDENLDRPIDVRVTFLKQKGQIYFEKGDLEEAMRFVNKAIEEGEDFDTVHRDIFRAYKLAGDIEMHRDLVDQAESYYALAENQLEEIDPETDFSRGELYLGMANTHFDVGMMEETIELGLQSLEINQHTVLSEDLDGELVEVNISEPEIDLNIHSLLGEAYAEKYRQNQNRENLDKALEHFDEVVEVSWEMRRNYREQASSLDLSERLDEVFRNAISLAYEGYNNTADDRYVENIRKYSQNSKSTTLQSSLIQSEILDTGELPEDLRQRKQVLRSEITHREIQIAAAESNREEVDEELLSEYKASLFEKRYERDKLMDSIRTNYSDYYQLHFEDVIISHEELQNYVDQDEVLVEYSLTDEGIYILKTSQDDSAVKFVKPDSETDPESIITRHFELASNQSVVRAPLRNELYDLNDELYSLLIEPVEQHLDGNKYVRIIPDGALHVLPFEMLMDPAERTDDGFAEQPFLIRDHVISYSYSPGLFTRNKESATPDPTKEVVAFAPVFEEIVETETFSDLMDQERRIASIEMAGSFEGYEFSALPGSREEVLRINELSEDLGIEVSVYLDEEANRQRFQDGFSGDIVHIATHGFYNAEVPALSGLAMKDPDADDSNTMMFTSEIYNLDLDADLVVLSSCESGFGELAAGEGMIALNRGFIQAGSNNVIYSMWKVSDSHTRELMSHFYENHFNGESYEEALRNAKLAMLEDDVSATPAHWAAFMLMGS